MKGLQSVLDPEPAQTTGDIGSIEPSKDEPPSSRPSQLPEPDTVYCP